MQTLGTEPASATDETRRRATGGDTPTPRLGVVIPLANEEGTVERFLDEVLAQLGPDDRVFCVLDRVCKDRTRELVERYGRERDRRAIMVWAPENRCVVDAYFRGYREAMGAGCRWILEMDGGFSHRPAEIPRFIAAMEGGADFVAGSRFTRRGRYIGWGKRRLISKGGTVLTNLLLGTRMADMTSGFECFTREALAHVLERGVKSRAHFFQTEIRVMMLREFKCVEVPITYSNPSKGCGKSSLKEALTNLMALRREARSPPAQPSSRVGVPTVTARSAAAPGATENTHGAPR